MPEMNEAVELARAVRDTLDEKKAEQIVLLDVRGLSSVTDIYLIATAANTPHIKALYNEVEKMARSCVGHKSRRRAGTPDSGWMVLDYLDVVVHLFLPETREFYALEKLWNDAPRID